MYGCRYILHCSQRGPMPPHPHASNGGVPWETNIHFCPTIAQVTWGISTLTPSWLKLACPQPWGSPFGSSYKMQEAGILQTASYCFRGSGISGPCTGAQDQHDDNCSLRSSQLGSTNVHHGSMPKKHLSWVQSLIELRDGLNNVYVFTAGVVHKWRWEENGDLAMLRGASLVSHIKGEDLPSSEFKWSVGKRLLQFDVNVEALAKAAEYLNV